MSRLTLAVLGLVLAGAAAPVQAGEPVSYDLALSRLRACAVSGAAGAPTTGLRDAMIAIRSLCRPQINRAYEASDAQVAKNHPKTPPKPLRALRAEARRAIDRDLAILVANQTGLSQ